MTEAFSAYIKTIAAVTLFMAFAEMLMPDNSFKKYIHLVTGILLLTVMVKPMLSLIHFDVGEIESKIEEKMSLMQSNITLESEEYYEQLQEETVQDLYTQEVNRKITQDIQTKFGENLQVQTEVEKDKNSMHYGNVVAVTIFGNCPYGEELKKYMAESYHIAPESISVYVDS